MSKEIASGNTLDPVFFSVKSLNICLKREGKTKNPLFLSRFRERKTTLLTVTFAKGESLGQILVLVPGTGALTTTPTSWNIVY